MLLRRNLIKDTTGVLEVPLLCPKSPIFSLLTPHPRSLAAFCQEEGYIVRAVVPPTVPTRRVRVCLHAGNTKEEIDGLVERVDLWLAKQLGNGILPSGPSPESFDEDFAPLNDEKEEEDFIKALL
jgi:hypothetical protein